MLDGAKRSILDLHPSLSLTRARGCWWWDHALHVCARDVPKRLGTPCCHGSVSAMVLEASPALQTRRLRALHGLAHQLPAANPADGFISHPAASWCLLAATLAVCRYFMVPPGGVLSHGGEQKYFPLHLPVKTRSLSPQSVSAPKLAPAGIDGNCSEQPDVGPHLSVLAVVLPWGVSQHLQRRTRQHVRPTS